MLIYFTHGDSFHLYKKYVLHYYFKVLSGSIKIHFSTSDWDTGIATYSLWQLYYCSVKSAIDNMGRNENGCILFTEEVAGWILAKGPSLLILV